MLKLVDRHASGACVRKDMSVRLRLGAPELNKTNLAPRRCNMVPHKFFSILN